MTIRTIKSSIEESTLRYQGKVQGSFRSDREKYNVNDLVQFIAYKNKKPVEHKDNYLTYVITEVKDSSQAPLEKGWQYIGYRRL